MTYTNQQLMARYALELPLIIYAEAMHGYTLKAAGIAATRFMESKHDDVVDLDPAGFLALFAEALHPRTPDENDAAVVQ